MLVFSALSNTTLPSLLQAVGRANMLGSTTARQARSLLSILLPAVLVAAQAESECPPIPSDSDIIFTVIPASEYPDGIYTFAQQVSLGLASTGDCAATKQGCDALCYNNLGKGKQLFSYRPSNPKSNV